VRVPRVGACGGFPPAYHATHDIDTPRRQPSRAWATSIRTYRFDQDCRQAPKPWLRSLKRFIELNLVAKFHSAVFRVSGIGFQ
jgi:hypothetical protein